MRQIDMESLVHYEHSHDDESLVIVARVILKEEIRSDCMQRALEQAVKRHRLFRCMLASEGRGLVYRETSAKPVLQKRRKKFRLGSAELNHLPYRISCHGRELMLSLHHGLTDGYGTVEFIRTLLYYYFCEMGMEIPDAGTIRRNEVPFDEEAEFELSHVKYYDPEMPQQPQQPSGPVVPFGLPVSYWDEENRFLYKRFKITLSAAEILAFAHRSGSSATAVVTSLISKAFVRAYDLEGKLLISSITSNLRYLLPSQSLQNFSGYFIMFYAPNMHSLSLGETAAAMKGIIQMNNTRSALLRLIHERTNRGREVMKMPVQELFEDKPETRQQKREVRQRLGYLLTNVGKLDVPDAMASGIEDMELYIPGITAPVVFGMNTVGDRMTLSVSQSFEEDALIQGFCEVCRENGLAVAVKDMGKEEFDTLGIDAVEMI